MQNDDTNLPAVVTEVERPKGFSGAEYNAVALGSSLEAIRLLKSSFDVKLDMFDLEAGIPKLSYGRRAVGCQVTPDGRQVAAIFHYNVVARVKRKKVLTCEVEYLVVYGIPEDSPEAAALGFCRNVGVFAAYPYFRSLVSQFAWNAGIELPPLPSIASTAHIPKKANSPEAQSQ